METKEYKGMEYIKNFHSLTDNVVSVLAGGEFPIDDAEKWNKFKEDLKCDRVLGIIEFPCVDIELEMWTKSGRDIEELDYVETTDEDKPIHLNYAVCGKYKCDKFDEGYCWELVECPNKDVTVDFSSADWEEELEKEMLETLEKFAERWELSYAELND